MEIKSYKNSDRIEHCCVCKDKITGQYTYQTSIFSFQDTFDFLKKYDKEIVSPFYTTLEEAIKYYKKNFE